MLRTILLYTIATCISLISYTQVELMLDFSNADNTIAFLKKSNPTAEEIESFIATPGVKAITKKIKATDSLARVVLQKVSRDETLKGREIDFQYGMIKSNLAAMEALVEKLKDNQQAIFDTLNSFNAFLPAGKKMPVTVKFLLGSYSSGFTFAEHDVFYLGIHQYDYDVRSIVNACRHELFHNVQNLYQDRGPIYDTLEKANELPALYVFYLAQNFFTEGSAEYVADLEKEAPFSPNSKKLLEHASVNNYRMADNFYLAERLLMDTHRDPEKIDLGKTYSILFDWNWNNTGYAMGKYMMQSLAKEQGPEALKKYLAVNPLIFLRDYIAISKKNSLAYPYRFSPEFEQMLDSVITVVEKYEKALEGTGK